MADKNYELTFELNDGSKKSVQFTAPQGEPGKTAYEYAKDGGYTGTEAEFAQKLASESGGVQSDWNQNDETQPDFVKNRPFYSTNVELFSFENVTFDSFMWTGTPDGVMVANEPYVINWDGVEYECVSSIMDGMVGVGNTGALLGETPGPEPFIIFTFDDGVQKIIGVYDVVGMMGGETTETHSFSGKGLKHFPIEDKYLPGNVKTVDFCNNVPGSAGYIVNSPLKYYVLCTHEWDGDISGKETVFLKTSDDGYKSMLCKITDDFSVHHNHWWYVGMCDIYNSNQSLNYREPLSLAVGNKNVRMHTNYSYPTSDKLPTVVIVRMQNANVFGVELTPGIYFQYGVDSDGNISEYVSKLVTYYVEPLRSAFLAHELESYYIDEMAFDSVCLFSPNGTGYRITVDDSGTLTATAIT